jgi:hypothetical protein
VHLGALLEGLRPGREDADLMRPGGRLTGRTLLHDGQMLGADVVDVAGVGQPGLGGAGVPG